MNTKLAAEEIWKEASEKKARVNWASYLTAALGKLVALFSLLPNARKGPKVSIF